MNKLKEIIEIISCFISTLNALRSLITELKFYLKKTLPNRKGSLLQIQNKIILRRSKLYI